MFVKQVKYTNLNGLEVEENVYFNLTKSEVMEMELKVDGTYSEKLETIFKKKNIPLLIKYIKEIILAAYGVKSDDGNRFYKNDKVREDFLASPAFDEIYYELLTDADKAAEFVRKIMPVEITDAEVEAAKNKLNA